jgi:anti-sigma factor RsiW
MTTHLAEHDLVRLLDDGAGDSDAPLVAHLDACGECTARRATLERRSLRLRRLMAATDSAAPVRSLPADAFRRHTPAPTSQPRWRLAAACTALLLGSLAVPPVRAWVAHTAGRLLGVGVPRVEPSAVPSRAPAPIDTAGTLRFTPAGPELTVEVVSRQESGALVIEAGPGAEVTAVAVGQRDAADLVVLPGRLRIGNAAGATGSYRVRVPLTLGGVVVRIEREAPVVWHPARAGERRSLDLSRPRGP